MVVKFVYRSPQTPTFAAPVAEATARGAATGFAGVRLRVLGGTLGFASPLSSSRVVFLARSLGAHRFR